MSRRYKIILIDDCSDVYEQIAGSVYFNLFDVEHISDPFSISDHLISSDADMIISEIAFNKQIDGIELLKQIKKDRSDIPVIVLSSMTDTADVVLALEIGAEDYVRKPFDIRELAARSKKVLSRSSRFSDQPASKTKGTDSIIDRDGLVINKNSYTVSVNGSVVPMPSKEIELLYCLASEPDKTFTRAELLRKIWGYDYFGGTRTIDTHIRRIRNKLEGRGLQCSIETVRGIGYKFKL